MHAHSKVANVKGCYGLRVYDAKGNEVQKKHCPSVKNTVTDNCFRELIFDEYDEWRFANTELYGVVGSGTSEISTSANQLGSQVKVTGNRANPSVGYNDNGDGTGTITSTWETSFSIGEFDGDQLSEVGVSKNSDGALLIAGQLIKDENGDPTTVTILSDEQLVIEYAIEITVPIDQSVIKTGTVTVKGESVGYTIYMNPFLEKPGDGYAPRHENADQHAGVFSDSGGRIAYISDFDAIPTSISGNQYTIDFSHTWSPTDFSSSSIKYIALATTQLETPVSDPFLRDNEAAAFILEFDTPIEKTGSEAFTLDFSITLEVAQG